MGVAHVGDDGDIGPHHLAQIAYLAEVVHARLDHRCLMLRRKPQQRQGRADIVVEVGLCFQGIVPPGQNGRHHLLGGGLSRRAGDLHHRQGKAAAIPRRQRLQRKAGIRHLYIELAGLHRLRHAGCQAAGGTGGQGAVDIGVAVEPLARQRDKKLSIRGGAAVSGNAGNDGGAVSGEQLAAHGGAQRRHGAGAHSCAAFRSASESSTIFSHRSA